LTHGTELRCVSLGEIPASSGAVNIGIGTYIGSQSIVLPGVGIGSRCIVGANSLVKMDVPDRSVVAGSPARKIGQVVGDGGDTHVVYMPEQ
jgi:acetyltransferase-like isoleucine patch superfamily enzyme